MTSLALITPDIVDALSIKCILVSMFVLPSVNKFCVK